LINNLPFNTSEYTDITIVIRQVLDLDTLINKDILKTITFKYRFENGKDIYSNAIKAFIVKIILLLTGLLIIVFFYIMFFEVSQLLNIDSLNDNLFNTPNNIKARETSKEILLTKGCVFDPFIKLFSTNSRWSYTPSYFVSTKLDVKTLDFNLLEYIIYNQYLILDYYTTDSLKYIAELNMIIEQHKTLIDRLLQ
jgi:hypothetical protein